MTDLPRDSLAITNVKNAHTLQCSNATSQHRASGGAVQVEISYHKTLEIIEMLNSRGLVKETAWVLGMLREH